MIETLDRLDRQLFQFLNGLHTDWLDPVMAFISERDVWIPLYVLLLGIIWGRLGWQRTLAFLVAVALLITITDQVASGLLKPLVARWRPCQPGSGLSAVHIVDGYCGGSYGFASSHAANFFGLATILSLLFGRRGLSVLIFSIATLVAYSRIYLGVHYPGDVLAGALIGLLAGWLVFWLYVQALKHWLKMPLTGV